eukprot:EG_transcript_12670
MPLLEHVPAASLFVSEPNPYMFGNPANDAANPAWSNANWLKSRFHFSFAEYHDPARSSFGVLRVMNDDLVQPQRGFGTHPHRDMEIVTYVVEGQLTHQDSMGQKETLGAGSVQFMTAGTGVRHSEHNWSAEPLRFIQIWINPRSRGLKPNYGSFDGAKSKAGEEFQHLVSDVKGSAATPIKLNQDVNLYVACTSSPQTLEVGVGRQAYLLCVAGDATATAEAPPATASQPLRQHDGLRLYGPATLTVTPTGGAPATVLVLEMKQP